MPPSCCEPCWSTWPAAVPSRKRPPTPNRPVGVTSRAVALFKRLRAAEQWLRWMADQLWQRHPTPSLPHGYRVRAIDATTVSRPGSLGTDWRLHFSVNLEDLQCDFFEVTDAHGGETFRRIPVAPGDLLLGDRCYGTPPGIAHVAEAGGHVLVRVNHKSLAAVRHRRRTVPAGRGTAFDDEWDRSGSGRPSSATAERSYPGRLVAVKRDRWSACSGAAGVAEAGGQEAKEVVADGAVPGGILLRLDRRADGGAGRGGRVGLVSLPLADRTCVSSG